MNPQARRQLAPAPQPVVEEEKVEEPVVPKTQAQLAKERIEALSNKFSQDKKQREDSAKKRAQQAAEREQTIKQISTKHDKVTEIKERIDQKLEAQRAEAQLSMQARR